MQEAAKFDTPPLRLQRQQAVERQQQEDLWPSIRACAELAEQAHAAHVQRQQEEQTRAIAQAVQAAISATPKHAVAEPEEIPVKIGRIREMWGDPIEIGWKDRQDEFSRSPDFAHCKAKHPNGKDRIGDYFPSRLLKVCQAKGYRFTRLDTAQSTANSAFAGGATVHRLR